LINSTIAKAGVEIFFLGVLSTSGENDGLLTKPRGLSLKNNFYNEIPSTELWDLYSKQATIYKRNGAKLNRHFQQQR
jgi:hypothetical protein